MLAGDPVHAEMEQVDDVEMKMDAAAPEATTNAPVGKDLLAASLFPELDAPAGPSHTVDDVIRDLSQDMSQDMLDWSDEEGQTSSFAIGTSGTSAPQSIAPGSFQPKPKPKPTPVPRELTKKDQDDGNFLALMKVFYQRLFPFKKYYQWLSYGNVHKTYFLNREFSFTLYGDIYLRFQSFKDVEELKQEIVRLCPVKIDIGAVYTAKPKEKKTLRPAAFVPVERELVFDIDMTDYDEIRTCCSGGAICLKCWDFMTISIKIIDEILRTDFGFQHLLWVYSGRRGVHCWICDDRARKLTPEARKALVSYVEVVKGGEQQTKKVNLPASLHPSTARSYETLRKFFPKVILENQNVFGTKESWSKVLALVPDEAIRTLLDDRWTAKQSTSRNRWEELEAELDGAAAGKKRSLMQNIERDIIFQYCYPRLDDKVTTQINHLLKSPFCVHPSTGRVCVPIVPSECDNFDPFKVPKLSDLVQEIEAYDAANPVAPGDAPRVPDFEKTSLKPYVELFDQFVKGLDDSIRASLRAKRADEDRKSLAF